MSDYSDIWFELNKDSLEREYHVKECKKRMMQELSPDDMIRIIFEYHISGLSDSDIIKLSEQCLKPQ